MAQVLEQTSTRLSDEIIQAFDRLNGVYPGYRPARAKGILLSGVFTPAPEAMRLTRAPHLRRASTPVTVRFSDFAGVPTVPDNDPHASPRGMATRFHLGEHVHTDVIAHSFDGFPTRTAGEYAELLRALYDSGASGSRPCPIETFLATHPVAREFVTGPKPLPSSFARECFYAVNAYIFTNPRGTIQYGRYQIRPEDGAEYLSTEAAAAVAPDFLFDEIRARLAQGPARFRMLVQLAATGDIVDNSTIRWPQDRPRVQFGTVELRDVVPNNAEEQRQIIFDPIPRVDGIDPSEDPLLQTRADLYLASGRRRRAGGPPRESHAGHATDRYAAGKDPGPTLQQTGER